MSEMTELETQLRSWVPRRPSARLERRLFAVAGSEPNLAGSALRDPQLAPVFKLSWLAPMTAALVLLGILFSQHTSPAISGVANNPPMVALILSNQSAAAYLPGSFQRTKNQLQDRTFEWTNGSGSTSSIRSLSFWKRGSH